MTILDSLEAAHATPKNVIEGNLRAVTQAQLDFYFLAHKAMPDLIAVARAAQDLYEAVEMDEAVGICLTHREPSLSLGAALGPLLTTEGSDE